MSSDKEYPTDAFAPSVASLEFVDGNGSPLKGLRYKIALPDGSSEEDTTDDNGVATIPSGQEGNVEITILSGEGSDGQED